MSRHSSWAPFTRSFKYYRLVELPWRHFDMSSVLLFRTLFFAFKIASFSSIHRLQLPDFLLRVLEWLMISHFILYLVDCLLSSQIYLESSVSFSYFSCLNDFSWLAYLSLSTIPSNVDNSITDLLTYLYSAPTLSS